MMLVVVKISVQVGACTNGVVNASGTSGNAVPASENEVVSDMTRKR
jgi:hypothetical protein